MFRSIFIKTKFSRFCTKSKVKEFEKRINSTESIEDYASIEQYSKIFNEKIYKQNVEIANKLNDIFTNDSGNTETKVFTAINEINKINLNNTSTMLSVFLNQILKYNDSVRLFIQHSERKNNKSQYYIILTAILAWVFGCFYLYEQSKKVINYESYFDKVLKNYYDNSPAKYKLDIEIPIFNNSEFISGIINFNNSKNIALIGPKNIGKSQAIINYCIKNWNKDKLIIYIDMSKSGNQDKSFTKVIVDTITEDYKYKKHDDFYKNIFNRLEKKDLIFVFDNYEDPRDGKMLFDNINSINNNNHWKSIFISSNNEIYEKALNNEFEIKYIPFIQTNNYKTYLYDNISNYCRKKTNYSNLELFTSENVNLLLDNFSHFSFQDLKRYLILNSTIKNFIEHKDEIVINKLRILRSKNPEILENLKNLVKSSKGLEKSNIPKNLSYDSIVLLEKYELIISYNFTEYSLLNNRLKNLIEKL